MQEQYRLLRKIADLPGSDCALANCHLEACSELGLRQAEDGEVPSLPAITLYGLAVDPVSRTNEPVVDTFLQELEAQGIVAPFKGA